MNPKHLSIHFAVFFSPNKKKSGNAVAFPPHQKKKKNEGREMPTYPTYPDRSGEHEFVDDQREALPRLDDEIAETATRQPNEPAKRRREFGMSPVFFRPVF